MTQRHLMLSGVGSRSVTLELLHAALLGRASPVTMSIAFMSLIPTVLWMILKNITAVLPLCSLEWLEWPQKDLCLYDIQQHFLLICPGNRDITMVAVTVSSSIAQQAKWVAWLQLYLTQIKRHTAVFRGVMLIPRHLSEFHGVAWNSADGGKSWALLITPQVTILPLYAIAQAYAKLFCTEDFKKSEIHIMGAKVP